ncbi:hypothetical protein CY0110_19597 [Crocosphaera chwakensis CCY0110]|uniref:Uncharacterized protein n=1 Tax=Crocosphaera chwakensis CCY0110 TaxID=391612 RepID=A3IJQ1_9CHRO|nr:hypothetical protein CY0110_19597 [Crocosphaera chwakensis CCY0110]
MLNTTKLAPNVCTRKATSSTLPFPTTV